MKKIMNILGLVFLVAMIGLLVIFLANPMNLRNRILANIINSYLSNNINGYVPASSDLVSEDSGGVAADKNPLLSADQEKALENIGVNVESLPQELTPAMQACFVQKLGENRTKEIVSGSAPSAVDFFKAKDCLSL